MSTILFKLGFFSVLLTYLAVSIYPTKSKDKENIPIREKALGRHAKKKNTHRHKTEPR